MQEKYFSNVINIIDDMLENIKFFRKSFIGNSNIDALELYKKIIIEKEIFKIIIEETIKATSIEQGIKTYLDIYEILIPFFKETITIDKIQFIPQKNLNDEHILLIDVFIDNKYYGILDPINQTYKLPLIDKLQTIAEEINKKEKMLDNMNDDLYMAAYYVQNPKEKSKKDKSFIIKKLLNKKATLKKINKEFLDLYDNYNLIETEKKQLNAEYEKIQQEVYFNRIEDEKLNEQLEERLGIKIILADTPKITQKEPKIDDFEESEEFLKDE